MDEVKKKTSMVDGHKLIMTIIFIAVTAVIFLAIGYMAGKSDVDEQTTALEQETTTATTAKSTATTTTTSTTADETADWKTYTNDEYGFSLKYPANASILTKENGRLLDESMVVAFEWEDNQDVEADIDLVSVVNTSDTFNEYKSVKYDSQYLQLRISKEALTDYSEMADSFELIK